MHVLEELSIVALMDDQTVGEVDKVLPLTAYIPQSMFLGLSLLLPYKLSEPTPIAARHVQTS